jgi:predicted acylesterase/phospholipase RssA
MLNIAKSLRSKSEVRKIQQGLAHSDEYKTWLDLANRYDEASGVGRWRNQEESSLYGYREIRERHDELHRLFKADDKTGLMRTLNEGVHGNIEGIGRPILYTRSKIGTKRLIEQYIEIVDLSLRSIAEASESVIPRSTLLEFYDRVSRCYGHSALMLSGGGGLIYFHHGVVQTLIDQGLLPKVISGSSAGSWVCAQLGTLSDEELKSNYFKDKIYQLRSDLGKGAPVSILLGRNSQYSTTQFLEDCFDQFGENLTFGEAYEKTGRCINISIAPADRNQMSRLMNAVTSPDVYIRSAVRASSSVPGVTPPVRLFSKGANGKPRPYQASRKWVDGSFADDLPAKKLARLYGVNHFIVSLINPLTLPFVDDPKLSRHRGWGSIATSAAMQIAQQALTSTERFATKNEIKSLAPILLTADAVINQKYTGDINIILGKRDYRWRNVLFSYGREGREIERLKLAGARNTWRRIPMISNTTRIARTLEEILFKLES